MTKQTEISKKKALFLGWLTIALAVATQLFNDFACYQKDILETIIWLWFPLLALIPAFIAVRSDNPLKAVSAASVAIIFYLMAYYTDCVVPYQGGGASMLYVIVLFYGIPLAVVAAWLTGYICNKLKIVIT